MGTNSSKRLLFTGLVGSMVAAVCCFTPVLVVLLGILGLSTVVGYLDYVLFPVLGIFLVITGYAVTRQQKQDCNLSERG